MEESEGVFFIAHRDRFKSNVDALKSAFLKYYDKVGIGYSYKTNHLPSLCKDAHDQGLYAEVVSGSEYEIAHALGVPGNRIIFNGPAKTNSELITAFQQSSLVNVDSLSEAKQIAALAADYHGSIRLGLRCNLDFQWKDRESRFGLSEDSGELDQAWTLLRHLKNVTVEGLHCHTSFDRSADSYRRRIVRLIEIADRLFGPDGPKFIDVGGGLCGPMSADLKKQFAITPPSYADYAEAICTPLARRYGSEGPELILEPGVGILGNVFQYAFRVDHVKRIGAKWFAMTSGASHHIKIVPNTFNLPLTLVRKPSVQDPEREGASIDIAGFTCLEHDVIYRGFGEALARGDILIAENVGAYSMVSSPDFIRTNPPVYERRARSWHKLRGKTSVNDYLRNFVF
ncbi:hypothetical protein [Marinobacter sp.]|uniref:hypothetical protein n=1 Tax=Marinobacter sp. TaxID=50741 RepID=UPI0035672BC6